MNKINYKEVPGYFLHCINADCPMAEHCLRQMAMQALPKDEMSVRILNPQIVKPSENCEFYRCDEPQVYAKGFTNMQKQMLPGQYAEFMGRLQGRFGRNPYFERRKGAQLCTPSEIKVIKDVLKGLSLEHLEFDAYEKHLNWTD